VPAAMYRRGLQKIQDGTINLETDPIKAVLVDTSAYGLAVTAATTATPIQITTSVAHGLTTNDLVLIGGVGGNTNANGVWLVTVVNSGAFTLQGSVGNSAFTTGGYVIRLGANEFLSDIPSAARSAPSAALASKTWTLAQTGVIFDGADVLFSAVPPFASGLPARALVWFEDTGSAASSGLLSFTDRKPDGSAFTVQPNSGDITVQTSDATNGIFRAFLATGASA
jgi:hypothetical protein